MCEFCSNIKSNDFIRTPNDYENTIRYIKKLIEEQLDRYAVQESSEYSHSSLVFLIGSFVPLLGLRNRLYSKDQSK